MIILRPKNVIFECFWPFSKFHFPACSTLIISYGYSIWDLLGKGFFISEFTIQSKNVTIRVLKNRKVLGLEIVYNWGTVYNSELTKMGGFEI